MSEYICLDPPRMGTYTVQRIEQSPKVDEGLGRPLYDVWVTSGHIQMGLRVLGELPEPGNIVEITGWLVEKKG